MNETPFAVADASRIRGLLGWKPLIPWSKTLADVLEFWRAATKVQELSGFAILPKAD